MKLVIESDEADFDLKEQVKGVVEQLGHEVVDIGCFFKKSRSVSRYCGNCLRRNTQWNL